MTPTRHALLPYQGIFRNHTFLNKSNEFRFTEWTSLTTINGSIYLQSILSDWRWSLRVLLGGHSRIHHTWNLIRNRQAHPHLNHFIKNAIIFGHGSLFFKIPKTCFQIRPCRHSRHPHLRVNVDYVSNGQPFNLFERKRTFLRTIYYNKKLLLICFCSLSDCLFLKNRQNDMLRDIALGHGSLHCLDILNRLMRHILHCIGMREIIQCVKSLIIKNQSIKIHCIHISYTLGIGGGQAPPC